MTINQKEPLIDWTTLVSYIVHPLQVEIVEALAWIDQPLSPTKLCSIFDDPQHRYLSRVSYHVGKLRAYSILEATGYREVNRRPKETFYFFPSHLRGSSAK